MEEIEEQHIRPTSIDKGFERMKDDIKKRCPKCGSDMKKWYLLGGHERWECKECGYKEEV